MNNKRLASIYLLLCFTAQDSFGSQESSSTPLKDDSQINATSENQTPVTVKRWNCSSKDFSPVEPVCQSAENKTPHWLNEWGSPYSQTTPGDRTKITPCRKKRSPVEKKSSPKGQKRSRSENVFRKLTYSDEEAEAEDGVSSVSKSLKSSCAVTWDYEEPNDYLKPITNLSTIKEEDYRGMFYEIAALFCSEKYNQIEDLFVSLLNKLHNTEDVQTFVNLIVNINLNDESGNVDLKAGDKCTNLYGQHFLQQPANHISFLCEAEQPLPNGKFNYYLQKKLISNESYFSLIQQLSNLDKKLYDYFSLLSIIFYLLNLIDKTDVEAADKDAFDAYSHNYLLMLNFFLDRIKFVDEEDSNQNTNYNTPAQVTFEGLTNLIDLAICYNQASLEKPDYFYLQTLDEAKKFLPYLKSTLKTLIDSFYLFSFEFIEYKKMMEHCKAIKKKRFNQNFEEFCTNSLLINFIKEVYNRNSLKHLFRMIPKNLKKKRRNQVSTVPKNSILSLFS